MPVHYSEDSAGPSTRRALTGVMTAPVYSYEEWSKPELQAELERRGLPKTGNKPELIAVLEEDDAA